MPARGGSRRAPKSDAPKHLAKAHEFLEAAHDSYERENYSATAGNSVQAGISAADALSVGILGRIWKGEHAQAPDQLKAIGREGNKAAQYLNRLLTVKPLAQYDPAPIPRTKAEQAMSNAERLLELASRITGAKK